MVMEAGATAAGADAGPDMIAIIALVLAVVTTGWAITQFFVNRHDTKVRDERDRLAAQAREERARDDDLDRRWLADKRLIYAKVLGALKAQNRVLADIRVMRSIIGVPGSAEAEQLARARAEWAQIEDALGEFDLLAPDAVREVVGRAVNAVSAFEWTFRKRLGAVSEADEDEIDEAFDKADAALHAALAALRADLGAGGPATALAR
ncbi:hypothetical protein [Cellulomonas composti]|nr:hypothetical protein [Cellulomonas composti]